jgi:Peptidase family M28
VSTPRQAPSAELGDRAGVSSREAITRAAIARHLDAIAREPRPAGGPAEARARAYCARELTAAGFTTREAPFTYSAAPGRYGMPAAGGLWIVALALAAWTGRAGRPGLALAALIAVAAIVRLAAPWALAQGVPGWRLLRREATNLVATRGSDTPTLWLVAHLDSKSQPVPMIARVVGVASCAIGWIVGMVLAIAQVAGADVSGAWLTLAIAGGLLALPVVGSVIGDRSPGAVDNASGIVTVLLAATHDLDDAPPLPDEIGVLVSSAEEVGLAGARCWAADDGEGGRVMGAAGARRPVALNVDTIDDEGALRVMTASPLPAALDRAIDAERAVERGRLPAGVLVDAIALATHGFAALTISRGTLRTLARIHTAGDARDALRGDGIAPAARLLRRLAAALDAAG